MDEDTSQAALQYANELQQLYGETMDINAKLLEAMKELASTSKGKMDFRGKSYATVALRVEMLRKHLGAEVSIVTDIVSISDETVVMRATVAHGENLLSTGYAEEHRSGKGVNSTSALENCETSAVGRALAALGLGGGEYASADELTGAVSQQEALEAAIKKHAKTIETIKNGLTAYQHAATDEERNQGLGEAAEAWFELTNDEKKSLWVAPTKGGPFSAEERRIMQTAEFRKAHYGEEAAA